MEEEELKKELEKLQSQYQRWGLIQRQVDYVLGEFPNLHQEWGEFVFNGSKLMNVQGSIEVKNQGIKCTIPIYCWLMEDYPKTAPVCYVPIPLGMQIAPTKNINYTGQITCTYVDDWKGKTSSLFGLIEELIKIFSEELPMSHIKEIVIPPREEEIVFPKNHVLSQYLKNYELYHTTKRDITSLLQSVPTLVFSKDKLNDLIKIYGTIPIYFDKYCDVSFFIPVNIWIKKNYPLSVPICIIQPIPKMKIIQSHYITEKGQLTIDYLKNWEPINTLKGLIKSMQILFSHTPIFELEKSTYYKTTRPVFLYHKRLGKSSHLKLIKNAEYKPPKKKKKLDKLEIAEYGFLSKENETGFIQSSLDFISEIEESLKNIKKLTKDDIELKKGLKLIYKTETDSVLNTLENNPQSILISIENKLISELNKLKTDEKNDNLNCLNTSERSLNIDKKCDTIEKKCDREEKIKKLLSLNIDKKCDTIEKKCDREEKIKKLLEKIKKDKEEKIKKDKEEKIKRLLDKILEVNKNLQNVKSLINGLRNNTNVKKGLKFTFKEEMETMVVKFQENTQSMLSPIKEKLEIELEKQSAIRDRTLDMYSLHQQIFINELEEKQIIKITYYNEKAVMKTAKALIVYAANNNIVHIENVEKIHEILNSINNDNENHDSLIDTVYGNESFFLFLKFHNFLCQRLRKIYDGCPDKKKDESFQRICEGIKYVLENKEKIDSFYKLAKEKLPEQTCDRGVLNIDNVIGQIITQLDEMEMHQVQKKKPPFVIVTCYEKLKKENFKGAKKNCNLLLRKKISFHKLLKICLKKDELVIGYYKNTSDAPE